MKDQQGGCLCGAVRYALKGQPQTTVICHCTHCQKQSGSAFSVNLLMQESDFELHGETRFFVDRGDSGLSLHRHFCPTCGSPIMTKAENLPGIAIVKAGTLEHMETARPQVEIYTDHAAPWFTPLTGAARFEQSPPAQ
ncbi:GFA family protein [Paraburkholderia sp. Ac-20336]|uniref:GFA family protein n=1 Tax=Burkholderiaceae TaxID=119060 RepID=UPI00141DDF3A|nr:GFA family protein [Paraburkholderia sp. Ac-20336]MBN3846586.1 GFA family protein [Paraburkholderia sp. Ac-20342]NIF55672.1 GFA family protein [Burkholderia sp. Ax-1724]NIF77995.1 GFA family protein [Paraburkholderia sp. Cy-641]